jgi:hypothetical protein
MPNLRYELKLVCGGSWRAQAQSWMQLHPAGFATAYPPRRVNNIYLDTPSCDSLSANLAGVSKRQKLRLRWYGDDPQHIQPWLELKVKENLLGDKKRALLPCTIDLTQSWVEILRIVQNHAPDECRPWLSGMIRPTLFNRYQREYYVTPDGAIRATVDFSQYACDQRFSPSPNLRYSLPIPDTTIIEIKGAPEEIDRLQEIVNLFPIPRSRNSKYVSGLLMALFTQ